MSTSHIFKPLLVCFLINDLYYFWKAVRNTIDTTNKKITIEKLLHSLQIKNLAESLQIYEGYIIYINSNYYVPLLYCLCVDTSAIFVKIKTIHDIFINFVCSEFQVDF